MFALLVFFYFFWGSYATIFVDGPCPDVTPVKNFNLTALAQGTWYQIARYLNDWEQEDDCPYITFNNISGTTRFEMGGILNGTSRFVDGKIKLAPYANGDGILLFQSPSFEGQVEQDMLPVYVLDVDYDKYVIGFECKYDEASKKHLEFAWVETRSKTVDDGVRKNINDYLKSSNLINSSFLDWKHFTDEYCRTLS